MKNKANDFQWDREAQKRGELYSGVWGIAMKEASLQESMGPIVDRTKEKLVSTDNSIIMARHKLRRAVNALIEKGDTPPGRDTNHHLVRSVAKVLPKDQPFSEACADDFKAEVGKPQTTV